MNEKNVIFLVQFVIVALIVKNLVISKNYIESHHFNDESNKLIASFMVNIISYDNPIKFFVSPFLNI
jgi:hypothetical protein